MDSLNENYKDLANAIVFRAALDYRDMISGFRPYDYEKRMTVTQLERFFYSDWYKTLTDVPADYIIEQIKKERKEK